MNTAWRLIDSGANDAAFNMALDEAIALRVRRDGAPPTLRLYRWSHPSVSIGCFQRTRDLDIDGCRANNVHIVRRPTGGRAVLHGNDLTYSFATQTTTGLFSKGLFDSYEKISVAFRRALAMHGIVSRVELARRKSPSPSGRAHHQKSPFCFRSVSYAEISFENTKIIGSAQKRWPDGLLQQGAIPLSIDTYLLSRVFAPSVVEAIESHMMGLEQIIPSLSVDALKHSIRTAFEETFHVAFVISSPSLEEIAVAEDLMAEKYLNDSWTWMR